MRHGGDDDVRQVVIDQAVQHFPARSCSVHHPCRLEYPQMLADQRLGDVQGVHQFVDTPRLFAKLQHDGDAHGCGQRAQQIACRVEYRSRG